MYLLGGSEQARRPLHCWLLIKKILLIIINVATVVLTVILVPRVFLFLAPLLQLLVLSLLAIVYGRLLSLSHLSISEFLFKILSCDQFSKIMFVGGPLEMVRPQGD
jgi:hypothetical protein